MNLSGKNALEQFLERARPLYTMPAVAVEVLALIDDPRVDAARLKSCIERDPALTAKLLRVVNSSLYSPTRPIADLSQAVALLGIRALKLLALGFCLPERMFAERASDALAHYWQRTLLRAVAARELAAAARWKEGEEAFLAALLADLGVAVLLQEATDDYLPVYEGAQAGDFAPLDAERRVFGFDRNQLTRRLLTEWRLPSSLIGTIDEARDGGNAQFMLRPPARLVYVAELLAAVVLDERIDLWPALADGTERHLRISPETIPELGAAVEVKAAELAGAFRFARLSDGLVREVLDRAGRMMPAAAEEAVQDLLTRRARSTAPGNAAGLAGGTHSLPSLTAKPTTAPLKSSITADDLKTLHDYLRSAAIVCRQDRAPLSLCLIEAGCDDDTEATPPTALVGAACADVDWPGALTAAVGPTRTALVLPRCDRRGALGVFEELRSHFRRSLGPDDGALKLSVGMAVVGLPPRDFPVDELIAAAERCLYAAQSSAGDAAKSIESY